jgi:hypothetical protein
VGEQAKILARVLARRLISLGATELKQVWPVYLEFAEAGGDGDFAALLVSRGVATSAQIEQARTTPTGESGEYDPAVLLANSLLPRATTEPPRHKTRELKRAPGGAKKRPAGQKPVIPPTWADGEAPPILRTLEFSNVLAPPATPREPEVRSLPPPAQVLNPIDEDDVPLGLSERHEDRPAGLGSTVAGSGADDPAFDDTLDHTLGEPPGVADAQPPLPAIGDSLGGYELTGELGRGAMGVVYEAMRQGSTQDFAVKVLLLEGATRRRTARFQREMQILRGLDHPNLVRLHDTGREGPYEWFAMDLVVGEPLDRLLTESRLAPREKLELFQAICVGVGHAHEQAVVHRDLKPANVLIGDDGHVTVLDFGLAKIEDGEGLGQQLTQSGTSLGTPWYMSPEQVTDPSGVDPRSDVFALGTMLYQILTGRLPFPGNTTGEVFYKILNHQPTPPVQINTFLHPDVNAICMRALEKEPQARYPTAKELGDDLARYLAGKGVTREPALGRAMRWLGRHKAGFAIGLGLASAAWAGLLYLLMERLGRG